jgi:hypothetical protein
MFLVLFLFILVIIPIACENLSSLLSYVFHHDPSIVLFHDPPQIPKTAPHTVMYLNTYHLVLEEVFFPPSSHQNGVRGAKPKTR